jgi:hypothetical protein
VLNLKQQNFLFLDLSVELLTFGCVLVDIDEGREAVAGRALIIFNDIGIYVHQINSLRLAFEPECPDKIGSFNNGIADTAAVVRAIRLSAKCVPVLPLKAAALREAILSNSGFT